MKTSPTPWTLIRINVGGQDHQLLSGCEVVARLYGSNAEANGLMIINALAASGLKQDQQVKPNHEDNTAMKTLYMTVGLPRSGKSTWARRQLASYTRPVVCPDEIRLAMHGQRYAPEAEELVWAVAQIMVKALFGAGHDAVVLDATNLTQALRDKWRNSGWKRVFVTFTTSENECLNRADADGRPDLIGPIQRMAQTIEWPTDEELDNG